MDEILNFEKAVSESEFAEISKEEKSVDEPLCENTADDLQETVDYEKIVEDDLRKLAENFQELSEIKDITELENPMRYAELRDLGLSPEEAYLATRRTRKNFDNRSHLLTSMPKSIKNISSAMTRAEMEEARELFPDMSDAQIQQLYKSVTRQKG